MAVKLGPPSLINARKMSALSEDGTFTLEEPVVMHEIQESLSKIQYHNGVPILIRISIRILFWIRR